MRFLSLIKWYRKNKRDLPWRNTQDPYLIWMSEIILQQTRVEQGLPYYLRYVKKYNTVKKLAAAPKNDVIKLWQGLGYYNRAENMLNTAILIAHAHKGKFPGTHDELIQLKGIGPYTAAAIASFAYNEAKPVLDGNVYRVLSRVFGIYEPIDSTQGKKLFYALAEEHLDKKDPATHNQAMMELGATICKPRNPLCQECPLIGVCEAFALGIQHELPVKSKKKKPKDRYLHYLFMEDKGATYIRQRTGSGIWKNLYEPPFVETTGPATRDAVISEFNKQQLFQPLKSGTLSKEPEFTVKHQLTHQTIYACFWVTGKISPVEGIAHGYLRVKLDKVQGYAVHRLFDKFLNYLTLQEK